MARLRLASKALKCKMCCSTKNTTQYDIICRLAEAQYSILKGIQTRVRKSCLFAAEGMLASQLVLWAKPSQRITSGLNTNFTLSPNYSFHKSSYHVMFFLSLFMFRGHSTWTTLGFSMSQKCAGGFLGRDPFSITDLSSGTLFLSLSGMPCHSTLSSQN